MQNVIVGLLLVTVASVAMHLETPGEPQQKPIALVGGRVYTVSSGIIERGTVLFDRGKIVAVGSDVPIPADAVRIDCQGKNIYPGLFAPHTTIGLIEIEAVRATRDAAEVGSFNPNVRADVAYNPDSEVIPTVRSNGVLLAVVAPEGGLISGIASVMQLDGWTREDIALRPQAAVVVNFPTLATFRAPWVRRSRRSSVVMPSGRSNRSTTSSALLRCTPALQQQDLPRQSVTFVSRRSARSSMGQCQ